MRIQVPDVIQVIIQKIDDANHFSIIHTDLEEDEKLPRSLTVKLGQFLMGNNIIENMHDQQIKVIRLKTTIETEDDIEKQSTIGKEFSLETLKSLLADDKLGTDELLGLLSEFIGDKDISRIIDEHIDNYERTCLFIQKINTFLENLESSHDSLKEDIKKIVLGEGENTV